MGTPARIVDPREAGLLVRSSNSGTIILPESYRHLGRLNWTKEILCVPGFFGVNEHGHTVLFLVAAQILPDPYWQKRPVQSYMKTGQIVTVSLR